MDYTKGGRGKKAPYETTHRRIPTRIKPLVDRLVTKFHGSIHSPDQFNEVEAKVNDVLEQELPTQTSLMEGNKQISARIPKELYERFTQKVASEGKQSGKVIEQLLKDYCTEDIPNKNNQEAKERCQSKGDLNKREYFAAMAMQGLMANPDVDDTEARRIAESAVNNADELIEALNEEE